ncbi:flagellar biosynthesis anti-sigma factor FlgM [Undibacterium sp. TJN25]|uniref:flagellar biosynthesis anti-sigma factor FlgM n=1 Tax=Undibacterium sp. TJN25 TaxID=3413056 RepID=UPI003BF0BFAB
MRISTGTGPANTAAAETSAVSRVAETAAGDVVSTSATSTAGEAPALQSSVLQPALAAMRDMPEIDQAKVAALRDALAKGEITFNPAKLAGLIQRFHGSDK